MDSFTASPIAVSLGKGASRYATACGVSACGAACGVSVRGAACGVSAHGAACGVSARGAAWKPPPTILLNRCCLFWVQIVIKYAPCCE